MTTHINHSAAAKPVQQQSALLTIHEVAKILRVNDATIRRWIRQDMLEAVVLPQMGPRQRHRVKRETLKTLLNGGRSDE